MCMKTSLTLKRAFRLAILSLLSVWAGYALGYHRGTQISLRQRLQVHVGIDNYDNYFAEQNRIPDKPGK